MAGKAKSARLRKCLAAGDVLALFPLMRDWSEKELRALLRDVGGFYESSAARIAGRKRRLSKELAALRSEMPAAAGALASLDPGSFSPEGIQRALDRGEGEVLARLMAICSGISSVAVYYIGERKKNGKGKRGGQGKRQPQASAPEEKRRRP